MPASARRTALVLATDRDLVTRYNFPAGWEASRILRQADSIDAVSLLPCLLDGPSRRRRNAGLTGSLHETLPLPAEQAHAYLVQELQSRCGAAEAGPARLVLGFASAHGSRDGLRPTLGGEVFFSDAHARFFDRAVLVFAACMHDGSFPQRLVSLAHTPVSAVIGYGPELRCPVPETIQLWGQDVYHSFKQRFIAALVQPIRSLLLGRTAAEACQDASDYWGRLVSDGPDARIKGIAEWNRSALAVWGDKGAVLC